MSLRSLGASALLHGLLVLLLVFGLPQVLKPEDILYQPQVISVELDIAPVANAPTRTPTPPKKPTPQPPKPKPTPAVEPEPVKKPEPPKPKPPEPKPEPVKQPEPKKEEAKTPEKQPEPKKEEPKDEEPSLDDILSSIPDTSKNEPEDAEAEEGKAVTSDVPYDPSQPASQTVVDSIRNQIMECWNYQGGAKEQSNLIAYIRVVFREDGSIITTELRPSDAMRYNSDPAFRALVDSARRATRDPKCVPLKGLPRDQYASWSKMELVFNPADWL